MEAMTIDGKAVAGEGTFDVVDPALGTVTAQAPQCGPGQLDQAVRAAARAQRDWRTDEDGRRKAMLADIAILTGGQAISEEVGLKLENTDISLLGRARKVVIDKDSTNGTYLNAVESPRVSKVGLHNGDRVYLGKKGAAFTYFAH